MSFRNLYLLILLAALVICIDQVSKLIVVEIIMQPPHVVRILPFLNFNLSYNTGLGFGLVANQFQSSPRTLILFTTAITASVIFWGGLRSRSKTEAVSAGLIAGGAAGNIIDRSLRGAVTDFLDLHIAGLFWPTFNLADFAIVGGILVLVGASIKSQSSQEKKPLIEKVIVDEAVRMTGSELIKKRRKSNLLIMVLLLVFVGSIYYSSFMHMQKETEPISVSG